MAWWDRMASPVRNAWAGVAARLRIRQSGLRRLRREVSTCEYGDVHVMWELLRSPGRRGGIERRRRRRGVAVLGYGPCSGGAAWASAAGCRSYPRPLGWL